MTRILGIDPGSQRTGVGVIDVADNGALVHVWHGALVVGGEATFPLRLKRIFDELCDIIATHQPAECGIERVFMARNPDSALKLGQARGAAICGTADANAVVFEYATRQIKQAVVGSGSAEKAQVQLMMKSILKLDGPLSPDAADALAAAVCHALRGRVRVSVLRSASRG